MYSEVTNNADLFSQNLPEMKKIRSLYNSTKLLFKLPENRVVIFVETGGRNYRLVLYSPDVSKCEIGYIEYNPVENLLSISCDDFPGGPVIVYKGRRIIQKNYSKFLDLAGFDSLFSKLVNSI